VPVIRPGRPGAAAADPRAGRPATQIPAVSAGRPGSAAGIRIFEDGAMVVLLAPAALGGMPGHTLVATRRHAETNVVTVRLLW
jgi:hypothetical protein